ncbi:sugar phosphate permease [Orbus hercynius]|uniref:Sugar phosphate permease n=1 Tax=Orbus hercynius TaxID=593135 RepID=A0A495RKF9_9GAMM|nr:MFS transporter [Orbus hercynius]RKS87794.1 sugar phosphate permease [Orbus hercynius]
MSISHTFENPILNSAIKKTWRRLMPFMFIMYFVAFIDRINIGFAKDAFAADINLSNEAYALGAGIFFASYALCGIPANLMMNKLGAKRWLGATTVLWGVLSALTGFVTNEIEFIILRFVLGMAEACFYPGILLLASIFFPNKIRGTAIGIFVLGVPLALTLGSPLSGALLELHGWLGKPGWFWMFVLEGLPAAVLGLVCFFYLDDKPSDARFLTAEERDALTNQLASEQKSAATSKVSDALKNTRVWHLALIYGTIQIGVYGLLFFLPSQVATLMGTTLGFKASLVAAIPWAISALGVYYIPRYADQFANKRVGISIICMVASAIGLTISAYAGPVIAIIALCVCATGFLAVQPIFWTFPPQLLTGSALAAGIGFITTIGAFCSFLAPNIRVYAEKLTNSASAGLITLSLFTILCAILIAFLGKTYNK